MNCRVFVNIAQLFDHRASTFDELLRIAILEFNGNNKVYESHCEINRPELPVDFAATLDNFSQAVQGYLGEHLTGPKVYVSPSGRGEFDQTSDKPELDKGYIKDIKGKISEWQEELDYCNILCYLKYNPEIAGINSQCTDHGVPKSDQEISDELI